MQSARHELVEEIFHRAAALAGEDRPAFVRQQCGNDDSLFDEVMTLLSFSDERDFLDRPAWESYNVSDRLETGEIVGRYRVDQLIGSGGMGEVYRAHDPLLARSVAIKVIGFDFMAHPQALDLFGREAHAAAALHHPNICTVFDVGYHLGAPYIVFELLEGETLHARAQRHPPESRQLISWMRDVADALGAAHRVKVFHCDIKPANLFITKEGVIKILDFGIARFHDSAGTHAGSMPFMAPEQRSGGAIDARTDLYSLGKTIESVAAPAARRKLARVLRKLTAAAPEHRYQSAGELQAGLRRIGSGPRVAVVAATITLAVAAGGFIAVRRDQAAPTPVPVHRITTAAGSEKYPTFSPKGDQIAYTATVGNVDLFVQPVDASAAPSRLTDDPDKECHTSWSPDGQWIAMLHCNPGVQQRETEVWVMGSTGGPKRRVGSVKLQDRPDYPLLNWLPDSRGILITGETGLVKIDVENGISSVVSEPARGYVSESSPAVSPDGKRVAFVSVRSYTQSEVFVRNLSGPPELRRMVSGAGRVTTPTWLDNNELLYVVDQMGETQVWRKHLDGRRPAIRVPLPVTALSHLTYSARTRSLAYTDHRGDSDVWRMPLRGDGSPERIISSTRNDSNPQVSPDGTRIAYSSERSGILGIWIWEARTEQTRLLTTEVPQPCGSPRWSPDGRQIAFDVTQGPDADIWIADAVSGKARRLTTGEAQQNVPSWSRDGRFVYFNSLTNGRFDIWKQPVQGGSAWQVTRNGGFNGWESHDGRWLVYARSLFGTTELWRMPADGSGSEQRIAPHIQSWLHFAIQPRGVYYVAQNSIDEFDFTTGARKSAKNIPLPGMGFGFAVTPDNRWIYFSRSEAAGGDIFVSGPLE